MTQPVRVLYVTADATLGEAVESRFGTDFPDVTLSAVTGVEQALDVLGDGVVDCVVVDSAVDDLSERDSVDRLRRAASDERVELVPGVASEVNGYGHRLAPDADQVGALARRIERAVSATNAVEGEHFRALAETLSDAILVVDADSRVRFANPAVEDVFGYSPDELVGEPLTTLMPDDLAERHRRGLGRYLREGDRHLDWSYVELTGKRRNGREIPLGISFSEFVSDGELRFTGVVRDISDRKCRESELRERVRQQRALSEFSQHALEEKSLGDLFDEAVELVAEALDHGYCGILEFRPEVDDLLLRAGVGWPDEMAGSETWRVERGSQAGYTLLSEEPVVVENWESEERFSRPESFAARGIRSGISAVVGPCDDPWGILGVHDTDSRSYADHDVQFVQSMAHVLTTAIQRRERDRQLERYEAMLNAVDDGVYALDADSRFLAVNDAFLRLTGYDRDQLLGEPSSTVFGERPHGGSIRDRLDSGDDAVTVEATLPTAGGDPVTVEARVSRFSFGGESGQVGVVRDVSDRKRREEKLTSLHEMMQSLADAERPTEIADLAVDAAVETLGFPNAAIALYDDEASTLVSTVQRWSGETIDDALLGNHAEDVAWRTFVTGETRVLDDLDVELDADVRLSSALAVPLGKHGVFIAASPERDAFDETDSSLADILCSNVRSALSRAEREETLRNQRNVLEDKNRELGRVERLNRVIREITKALTQASSREDVMQSVCDRLTDAGPYRLAWFGEHDRATDEVEPRAWAGVEEGYLQEVVVTADDEDDRGNGPAGRAVRTGEIQVQNDLLGDPPFEPWREEALERGYRASASIPVTYGGSLWGLLNLYADEPGIFNETEREVLSELGETIGYALNALEQRRALVSDRSIELDFRVRGSEYPILSFVTETDAEFEFENVVQRADGQLHLFFTVRGTPPDEALAFAETVSEISDTRLLAEREGEYVYHARLSDSSFLASLVDRGAVPRTITATDGEGRFVVRVPHSTDVRALVELFEGAFDEVELVARRERDEPVMSRQEFETELQERLTDRQQEVLQMAYFGGFFEWPRGSTAEEIADALDVSQPTVSRHVRGAERALFGLLFEEN